MFRIISSILHLGNIKFEGVEHTNEAIDSVSKNDPKSLQALENFSDLMILSKQEVLKALTSRKFHVKNLKDSEDVRIILP